MIKIPSGTPFTDSIRENRGERIIYLNGEDELTLGPPDGYAHVPEKLTNAADPRSSQLDTTVTYKLARGLRKENTRGLTWAAYETLMRLREAGADEVQRLMFLGPGAGVEIAEARKLLPGSINTVNALTPVSPTVQLSRPFESMRDTLWAAVKEQGDAGEKIKFSWMRDALSMNPNFSMNLDQALQTKLFTPIPGNVADPDRQFIGSLTEITSRLDDIPPQNWLYQQHGALSKILFTHTPRQTVHTLRTILEAILDEKSIVVLEALELEQRSMLKKVLPAFLFVQRHGGQVGFHRQGPHADFYGVPGKAVLA